MLRAFRNSLTDESEELARRVQEVITEAENSEDDVEGDELSDRIQAVLNDRAAEFANNPAIENRIRQVLNDIRKAEQPKTNEYLRSRQAVTDFANAIRNARSANDFVESWQQRLVSNGITGLVFPEVISEGIANPWADEKGLLGRIRKVSDREFKILYTADDEYTASGTTLTKSTMALGHAKGTQKVGQTFEVSSKKIEIQGIYKDLYLDRVDLAKMGDDAAFVRWVVDELNRRLAYTIERTIIAGNPYAAIGGGTNNYNVTSFESLGTKTSDDAWTEVTTLAAADSSAVAKLLEGLYELSWGLNDQGNEKWLYVNPAKLAILANRATSSTSPYVVGLDALANELGVSRVIPYSPLVIGSSAGTYAAAVIVTPNQYYRVGGEAFGEQWTIYDYNREAFRAEVFAGGAVGGVKSTGVLRVTVS